MRRSSALILCLDHPFVYHEKAMSATSAKKRPNASNQVHHMQGHQIRTSEHTSEIWLQEVRPREGPLSWRNRDEQIRKGAQPYLSGDKRKRHTIKAGPQKSGNSKICLVVTIANNDDKAYDAKQEATMKPLRLRKHNNYKISLVVTITNTDAKTIRCKNKKRRSSQCA